MENEKLIINHSPLPCKTLTNIHTFPGKIHQKDIHSHTQINKSTNQQIIRIESIFMYTLQFNGCDVAPFIEEHGQFHWHIHILYTNNIKRHQHSYTHSHTHQKNNNNKQIMQKLFCTILYICICVCENTRMYNIWLIKFYMNRSAVARS